MIGVLKSNVERLTNEKTLGEAIVSNMGMEVDGKHINLQEGIYKKEVKKV